MDRSRARGISWKFIDFIVYRRTLIEKFFILLTVISAICFPFVGINYDLSKYLPDSTSSKQGINLMEDTFGYPGTARVMIKDVSLYEAKNYKDKIENIDGIDMVTWADSKADIYQSSQFIQYENIDDYYKNRSAVMDIVFDEGDSSKLTHKALKDIKTLLGNRGYLSGSAVQDKFLGEALTKEMASTMVIAVIIIAVILSLATTSWFEPLIFMLVIFIAIVINMGSNIFLGEISFLTFSCAALLQLAIAMDYTIILLDAFTRERAKGLAPEPAVANAIRASITPISSAGAAAFVGFIALTLMRFSIGSDLGIVLAKGIAISLVTIVFLMPALILRWYDKIEKLTHKPFVPSFHGMAQKVYQLRYFIVIISLLLAIPSFVAKDMNSFTFGNDAMGSSPGTVVHEDEQAINKEFGRKNLLMLLIPDTSLVKEKKLSDELDALDYVNGVTSLAGTLPEGVPESFLPTSLTSQLHTKGYARILVTMRTASESELAFKSTDEIRKIVKKYYPQNAYVIGVTPSTQDIKSVIVEDYANIDLLSLLGVAVAIALAYRSLSLPIVLMIPIQFAVFVNMAVPYIFGDKLMYMGYIIVSCLQLGATIDYSILMTNHYLEYRKTLPKKEASIEAAAASALPILTSGLILAAAGYGLYFSSSVSAVADLGRLVGRGAVFSMLLVLLLLPNLFLVCDRFIIFRKNRREHESTEQRSVYPELPMK